MAITNRDRVGKTLDILSDGLKVFVAREMKAVHGERWRYAASDALRDHHFTDDGTDLVLDTQALFLIMWDQWKTVFQRTLGHSERNYVSELREVRNKWAHQQPFSTDDTYRALDTAERGREATIRLKQIIGRIESPWRPADRDESFEIVRRRLFDTILDYPKRDAVAKTFAQFYQDNRQEFPRDCHEAEYERRLKDAYPIHPELFDRLFTDWSGIEKFQRTRGVLRLMAAIITRSERRDLW